MGEGCRCKMVLCGFKRMDNLYVVRASYATRMYPSNVLICADRQLFYNCHIQDGSSDDPLSFLTLAGPVIQEDDSGSAALMNCDLPAFHKTPEPIS